MKPENANTQSQAEPERGEVGCGRPFRAPDPGVLRLEGRFPGSVAASGQTLSGTVEVTADEAVDGVALPSADAFLVKDGRVVSAPLIQDAVGVRWSLASGESREVPAVAPLMSCAAGGESLPPGEYEVYARFVLNPDDGTAVRAFGGPWSVQLR